MTSDLRKNTFDNNSFKSGSNEQWEKVIERVYRFPEERNWTKVQTPANLAKSISIEAAELLECFQWRENGFDRQHVYEELADVMIYCIEMAKSLNINLPEILMMKMEMNEKKYPVDYCLEKMKF